MKNKKSGSENKEFHHRTTIKDNTTSTKNLPKVTLFDNNFSNIQKDEKTSEPLKHDRKTSCKPSYPDKTRCCKNPNPLTALWIEG